MARSSTDRRREDIGRALMGWLNCDVADYFGKPTKASRARIVALITAINEGAAMLVELDKENPNADLFGRPPEHLQSKVHQIQEMLNEYPTWPSVEISFWNMAAVLEISNASGPGRSLGEQVAAWDIITLLNERRLELVRQCVCGKWFLARRGDQQSCSPSCRHKTYEQTEGFKVKRRAYMRKYYKLKQSGKVK